MLWKSCFWRAFLSFVGFSVLQGTLALFGNTLVNLRLSVFALIIVSLVLLIPHALGFTLLLRYIFRTTGLDRDDAARSLPFTVSVLGLPAFRMWLYLVIVNLAAILAMLSASHLQAGDELTSTSGPAVALFVLLGTFAAAGLIASGRGLFDSLRIALVITTRNALHIPGFMLFSAFLMLAGGLCLIIGYFFAGSFLVVAYCVLVQRMKEQLPSTP